MPVQQKVSQTDKIVDLVRKSAHLFHDQNQVAYARVEVAGHVENLPCRSSRFKKWVSHQMFVHERKIPASEPFTAALNLIEALALFNGPQFHLYNRTAPLNGDFWYDLSDTGHRAVRIGPKGWSIIDTPPILFRRFEHQAAQVEPVKGGDVHRIFDFVTVEDEGTRLLILTHLISCYVSSIPHPILMLFGSQGSGKSTFCTMVRKLVDPSVLALLSFPSGMAELVQLFSHHWMVPLDNLSGIKMWQSNALCTAVTGGGFAKRQLYSDDDDVIYQFRRCIMANGINVAGTQSDLMERSLLIELDRITPEKRRSEEVLWREFDQARAGILGGAFDALARAMSIYPSVQLEEIPRMADFAMWGVSIAEALGYSGTAFLEAYRANIASQNEEIIQSDPVAEAVIKLLERRKRWDNMNFWQGSPSDLLSALNERAEIEKISTHHPFWPKAANSLTRRLNTLRPNLLAVGILYEHRHGRENIVTLTQVESDKGGDGKDGKDAAVSTPTREPEPVMEWKPNGSGKNGHDLDEDDFMEIS